MNLNVYRKYPEGLSNFTKIGKVCRDRIQLYKIFETAKYNTLEEGTLKWSKYVISKILETGLKPYAVLLGLEFHYGLLKAKREDNLAHWMLGLSYFETEEQRNLYINWELQWFHLLFSNLSIASREEFLLKNDFSCDPIEIMDKILYCDSLIQCTEVPDIHNTKFYKTHFYKIPDVVSKRQVFLKHGWATFSENNLVYYVKHELYNEFSRRLEFQKMVVTNSEKYKILKQNIPKYIPRIVGCEVDCINLENIDEIAKDHFPLCMQHLHNVLRKSHHLKYDGKMQYGVFLYWLGLSYTDALEFWKTEFTQRIPEDLFNRRYVYLFKHQYGQIGRKRPYAQLCCSDILAHKPLPSQQHGCPFKHWSKYTLFKTLKCEVSFIKDIEDLVEQKEYQKACTRYLCKSRNLPLHILNPETDVIESPIKYVNQSFSAADVLDTVFVND